MRFLLITITCWCGGLSVIAQGPPPDTGHSAALIEKYDKNGDGKLSDAEIEAAQPRVSPKPNLTAVTAETASTAVIQQPYKDSTKYVNDREIQNLFNQFDVNQNGKLDLDEMEALRKNRKQKT